MESHLNDDQIEELLRPDWARREESTFDRGTQQIAKTHLQVCEICQSRVREQERAMERLAFLKPNPPAARGSECPPDNVWIEVAAGTAMRDSDSYLSHATTCDHCGPLLHDAAADLATDLTPEEESVISNLPSSSQAWQMTLAARLKKTGSADPGQGSRKEALPFWRAFSPSPGRLAFTLSAVGLIAIGVWFAVQKAKSKSPEQLIADAYTEKRILEVRIEGAPYSPLRQDKGSDSGSRMNRPALLKAEAEIAAKLETRPDDVRWLQASGRASMLEGDRAGAEAALTTLEKATRLAPNDVSVSIDLASSHILLDQLLTSPNDRGQAIEILRRLVSSRQGGEVAQYNYAIALEALALKNDAMQAWQDFLKQYPSSSWAPEARARLGKLQQEISARQKRSDSPLMPLEEVAAAARKHDENGIAEIDSRIEEYQDLAIQNWLPRFFAPNTGKSPLALDTEEALNGLARLLSERHNDLWLRDILKADRHSAKVGEAVRLLADSSAKVESSDESVAQIEASRALSLFQRSGVVAGQKRAQLILILVQQYGHQNWPCESMAQALRRDPALQKYPWIFGQVLLEDSFCASASDKQALEAMQAALKLARTHHFPTLFLRATAAESGLYSALGDSRQAWFAALEGLQTFWRGTYPNLRGYNALIAMDEIRSPRENWFLDAAVLQEAIPLVEGDPRTTMVAVAEAHLGQALMQTGDFDGADRSYRKAELLLKGSASGPQRAALSAEIELGFARVDLRRNNLQASLDRLDRIRPLFSKLPNDLLELDFFQTSGVAEFQSKHLDDAERDLTSAIGLSEKDLRKVDTESDRWKWGHRNELVYRALVELKLRGNPTEALFDWEWFKGSALRGRNLEPVTGPGNVSGLPIPDRKLLAISGLNDDGAVISFFLLPHGYAVWVWDQSGIREKWEQLDEPELSSLVMRMSEECSDPHSDASDLRRQGSILYQKLISPIEPWISDQHHLIVEPDGVLKTLPFGLLVDSRGAYLGDRFSVTISPGVAYLNRARQWRGLTAASTAVVLGDPKAPGWMPLPDAEQEARAVAASFDHPLLLMSDSSYVPNLASDIAQADIFHFSGHSQVSIESASLVMGTLGIFDPAQLNAVRRGRTQMVVLSACSSSRGRTGFFDDDDSMVRRLMSARVPEVLASRWTVDSAATTVLMKEFYSKLLVGMSPSEALNSATRTVRARPEFSHPYYWAGFSVFGRS